MGEHRDGGASGIPIARFGIILSFFRWRCGQHGPGAMALNFRAAGVVGCGMAMSLRAVDSCQPSTLQASATPLKTICAIAEGCSRVAASIKAGFGAEEC
jgi:hypothetical protein